jgi:hypothetical protein
MRPEKQFMWWENKTDLTANRVMFCVTLHAAAKSDRGFVGSKHKTRKIENSHDGNCTGSDRVTAR